jgi:hypothetical protein
METCTEEVGFLKKKPCGHASVTHCLNCERALCAEHAVAELSAAGKRTGKFMCKECQVAAREHDKAVAAVAKSAPPKKPAAPAAAPPGAPKAAAAQPPAGAPAAAQKKPEDSLGMIDFTPSDKPK